MKKNQGNPGQDRQSNPQDRRGGTPQDQRHHTPQREQRGDNLETQIRDNWDTIRPRLQEDYTDLTNADLQYTPGQESDLIGRIQKRTGQTREEFRNWVDNDVLNQ